MSLYSGSWIAPQALRVLSVGAIPVADICRVSARIATNQWIARNYCGGCGRHQDDHAIDCPAWMEAMEAMEQIRKMV